MIMTLAAIYGICGMLPLMEALFADRIDCRPLPLVYGNHEGGTTRRQYGAHIGPQSNG